MTELDPEPDAFSPEGSSFRASATLPSAWFTYTPPGYSRLTNEVEGLLDQRLGQFHTHLGAGPTETGVGNAHASLRVLPERSAFDAALEPLWRALRGGAIEAFVFDDKNKPQKIQPGTWECRSFFDDACLRMIDCVGGSYGDGPDRRPVFVQCNVTASYLVARSEPDPDVAFIDPLHSPFMRVMLEAARALELNSNDIFAHRDIMWWIWHYWQDTNPGQALSVEDVHAMARLLRWPHHAGEKANIDEVRRRDLGLADITPKWEPPRPDSPKRRARRTPR